MSETIIVAALGCLGTILGSGLGVIASSKLTNFRLQKLEEKVEKHNSVIERTFVLEEKQKVNEHRLADLERFEDKMRG